MSDNYKGVIIEESLESKDIIKDLKVINKEVEKVTGEHKTPWIKQWSMYNVEILENQAEDIANQLSKLLDSEHDWYTDFKNEKFHYIIFKNKVFKVDRSKKEEYDKVSRYGISLGIPEHQVDFSPHIKQWER